MKSYLSVMSLALAVACSTAPERVQEQEFEQLAQQLREQPENAQLKLQLGDRLAQRGYSEGAFRIWEEGLGADPKDLRFLRRIADHRYAIGEERAAIQSYERLVSESVAALDPIVFYKLGWASLKIEEYRKSMEAFQRYTRSVTTDAHGFTGLALAQRGLSQEKGQENLIDLAIENLQRATVLDPKLPEPRFNLACCFEQKGLRDLAQASYRRLLDENPDYVPAMVNLALLYLQGGDAGSARPLLQRAQELETDPQKRKRIQDKLPSM